MLAHAHAHSTAVESENEIIVVPPYEVIIRCEKFLPKQDINKNNTLTNNPGKCTRLYLIAQESQSKVLFEWDLGYILVIS